MIQDKGLDHDSFLELLKKEVLPKQDDPKYDGGKEVVADEIEKALRTLHAFL